MSKMKEHWQQHIAAWQKSDLSQAKYCKAHQLNQNQFGYWKHKLAETDPSKNEVTPAGFAIAQIAFFSRFYGKLLLKLIRRKFPQFRLTTPYRKYSF